jgi:predicted chitinase
LAQSALFLTPLTIDFNFSFQFTLEENYMVTDDELRQVMPNCAAAKRADYLPFIQQAMAEFDITSYLRETAFLAQLAHESGELRYMEEIASGAAYEGRADLGNTQPGDGKRFKGRGPIQLTGRANYAKYGGLLGLDLVNNPTVAATKEVGFRIAGQFWKLNGLNELADQQQFKAITKRINGGYNGLDDRIKYYERAKKVMSSDDTGAVPPPPPTPPAAAGEAPAYPGTTLRQGSKGANVQAVQQRLSDLGYSLSVDGNFGPGTAKTVVAFQEKNGLGNDGIVGPKTWAALWA